MDGSSAEFGRRFPLGIFDGFWWAVVTMTTVGYGDIKPLQKWSKLLSIAIGLFGIMLTGMIVSIAVYAATKAFELHMTHVL